MIVFNLVLLIVAAIISIVGAAAFIAVFLSN